MGWYENNAATVAMVFGVALSMGGATLEATGTSAGVSAICENGNVVMPSIGASESEGLPAYGW